MGKRGRFWVNIVIDFSFRYGVIGIYKDRDKPITRIYLIPFVRISVSVSASK
jgi:hypothetical protein